MVHLKLFVCIDHRRNSDITHTNGYILAAVIECNSCWINLNLVWRACGYLYCDLGSLLLWRERLSQLELVEIRQVAMHKYQMPL